MSQLKIVTIVGARPQFIKAAVVSRALQSSHSNIQEVIIHTGQHFDSNMSDIFFKELNIPEPNYNLGVGGGTHGENTGRMLEAIEAKLLIEKPDYLLVYGDTDSTLAGSLAAAKLQIPVCHIEAGLRSFNRIMPEELNRILTDHVSTILFTPTDIATKNLSNEGIYGEKVNQVGDVMNDAALFYSEKAQHTSRILEDMNLSSKNFVLATIHRAENTDDQRNMRNILSGFEQSPTTIVWPMHPRTKKRLNEFDLQLPASVKVIDPVGYLDMVMLEKHCTMIATDSGGVQKEAYFHGVPCLTLRNETEWVELVENGYNKLVGVDSKLIAEGLNNKMSEVEGKHNLYGNGDSGLRIVEVINSFR